MWTRDPGRPVATSDDGDAGVVAERPRRLRPEHRLAAVEAGQHAPHHAPVDGADDRVRLAVSKNGQLSLISASDEPRASAWASKPCAVRASATACRAERNDRCSSAADIWLASSRPYSSPDLLGHGLGLGGGHQGEGAAEQGDEQVAALDRQLEARRLTRHPVALGGTAGPGGFAAGDEHLDVATGRQLVQVMAGHVGVQGELLGHVAGRHALFVLPGEEVDPPPGGIAEGSRHRHHGGRKLDVGQRVGAAAAARRRVG